MNPVKLRLLNQQRLSPQFSKVEDVVAYFDSYFAIYRYQPK